jgi:hypothetical protein
MNSPFLLRRNSGLVRAGTPQTVRLWWVAVISVRRAGDFVPKTDIYPLMSTGEPPDGFFLPDVVDGRLKVVLIGSY